MREYETFSIEVGHDRYVSLLKYLADHGYQRQSELNYPGDYVLAHDRLTLLAAEESVPIQIDFFGNRVEMIKQVKTNKQKETERRKIVIKDNRLICEDGVIEPEGYLVHPHHGIGRFRGRAERLFHQQLKPFLLLEYAGADVLFFPQERERELMPYFGKKTPRLSRLHSSVWARTKQRITEDLVSIARELLTTQAERQLVKRPVWPKATDWEETLAQSFPHTLTADQVRAMEEITTDLTQNVEPMDRLLTGDVGYGKTEVAIRAAVHVLAGGGQVVVLAPTTILAAQHLAVWQERFSSLPIKCLLVSRLSGLTAEAKKKIAAGYYDCLIGTHKLFSAGIKLPNLGLVVIDEEQRFGIKQKEHFKKLRTQTDVLSLTATPIPRTLYLGLSGLRAMSLIRTAPGERRGVVTTAQSYNEETIRQAIIKERARDGQIYYVHNRINTLPAVVRRLRLILEPAFTLTDDYEKKGERSLRFAVAHGRTETKQLAQIMRRWFAGQIDILITTSIVENGLDNARANTMIVERAEHFGLADLYQLRGRIGRRHTRAYAWMLIGDRPTKMAKPLPETARERLETIADTERLGSGWSIALKDLEIRGAGTLIGRQQHGNLEAIGLVLYSRLLKRVVERLQTASSPVNNLERIMEGWSDD